MAFPLSSWRPSFHEHRPILKFVPGLPELSAPDLQTKPSFRWVYLLVRRLGCIFPSTSRVVACSPGQTPRARAARRGERDDANEGTSTLGRHKYTYGLGTGSRSPGTCHNSNIKLTTESPTSLLVLTVRITTHSKRSPFHQRARQRYLANGQDVSSMLHEHPQGGTKPPTVDRQAHLVARPACRLVLNLHSQEPTDRNAAIKCTYTWAGRAMDFSRCSLVLVPTSSAGGLGNDLDLPTSPTSSTARTTAWFVHAAEPTSHTRDGSR